MQRRQTGQNEVAIESLEEIARKPSDQHPFEEDPCHALESALRVHSGGHWRDCRQVLAHVLELIDGLSASDRIIVFCRLFGHELGNYASWMNLVPDYDIWGALDSEDKGQVPFGKIRCHFAPLFEGWTRADFARRQVELMKEIKEFCLRRLVSGN